MAIEDTLERIAVALEKIAANGGALAAAPAAAKTTTPVKPAAKAADPEPKAEEKKPEPKAEEKKPEPAPAAPAATDGPDIEKVRKALQDFRALEGTASMLEVLKEFGAENLAGIKPADYAAIVQRVS